MRKTNGKTRENTAFLYERLSRDDNLEGDSYSIQNQKKLLTKVAKEKGYTHLVHFFDDGISGVTMNRPGFKDMIVQLELGRASAVFVKDLSRLGRNYIEVGRLTEEFFPEHDIRFVSVSDAIDTDEGENELAPIRNLFNEWYSRDISKKRRISNKIRGSAGEPMGPPPYGYTKNPDGSKSWVVDPEAAAVVRRIFMLTLDGHGSEQIAAILTGDHVLTPTHYWKEHGVSRPNRTLTKEPFHWNGSTVVGILTKQEYCGDVVNFKTYSKSYKSKARLKNCPEDMAVFKDVHEAIVPRELWERVQQQRAGVRRYKTKDGERNMFSGLLVCADCGHNLHYHFNHKNPEITYFSCPNTKSERGTCTGTHYIRVDFLEKVVLGEIRRLTKFVSQYETQFAKLMMGFTQQAMAAERKQAQLELSKVKARDRELDTLFEKLYEDNVAGKISDERFVRMSKKYEVEQAELHSSIKALQADIERIDGKAATADMFISAVRKYTRARKLTPRMLNELIDKIEVHQAEKVNGVWRQRLTIHYKCVGAITLPDTATIQAPHVTMNTRQGVYVTYEPDTPSPAAETVSA